MLPLVPPTVPAIIAPSIVAVAAVKSFAIYTLPPDFVDISPNISTLLYPVTTPFELMLNVSFPVEFLISKRPFIVMPVPVISPKEVIDAVVFPALLTFIEPPLLTFIEP